MKNTIMNTANTYIMGTYNRLPVVLVKGKGAYVWDQDGKQYLDFFPGWAVSGLGHCHPHVVKCLRTQADVILHVANNFYSKPQAELAKEIIQHSFSGKVFFANSGAEANEAAIKLTRRFGHAKGRYEIITMQGSFHGRTLATLTATGQTKYQEGYDPLPEGFCYVPFNDLAAVKKKISRKTIAIMLEPIQGEGGIQVADKAYLQGLRRLCDQHGLLLIFDEVQTGMGRTGKMFCFQHYAVTPDIMTLAKSLGGGVPIGAMVASSHLVHLLPPGSHASTFGGSPIVCAAALGVFEAIKKDKLLKNVAVQGAYLYNKLLLLAHQYPSLIREVRGQGLMWGIELHIPGDAIVKACLEKGLIVNCTQKTVLRCMPPLIVTKSQIDTAVTILEQVMKGMINM